MSGHRHKAPIGLLCGNLVSTLVARRHEMGLTQFWLARKLGMVSRAQLGRLETGRQHPTMPTLVNWARELGLHVRLLATHERGRRGA